jgi:hypothetical protein
MDGGYMDGGYMDGGYMDGGYMRLKCWQFNCMLWLPR